MSIEEIRDWAAVFNRLDPPPITDADIVEMFELTRRYGPANGWAGASGTLAAMLARLIAERMGK